ncbi:MAG: TonB-dependent receptor [Bacteroidaceae bacterium]|nr:TonB-dependent receptor [Bacteroidaceae bacterium]
MNRLFLICCFLIMVTGAKTQTIRGLLIDEQHEPLPYANVILQTADSVYLTGTTTGLDGRFELALHEKAKLINFSYVGYTSVVQKISKNEIGEIQLLPDAKLLGEVVIKDYLPKTQAKGDAMVTTVSGTVLEKSGTADNLLDKIPNVTAQDGAVTVFGRGTPEIYINGRKVRNQQELDQLSSDNIKSVEVVSNPGARYDASVKAVIRIFTKKVAGEGFGFDNRAVLRNIDEYGWAVYDQLNLNYRRNGFDISAMLHGGSFRSGNDQTFVVNTHLDKQWLQNLDLTNQRSESKDIETTLTLNYQFDEHHSIGARYNYERIPEYHWIANQFAQTFCEDILYENLHSIIRMNEPETHHRSNFYYNGRVKKWSIDFNADGLWSETKNTQVAKEDVMEGVNEDEDRSVTTIDTKRNELYAAKLVLSHPLAKGNISFGAEYSHNKRNTTYLNPEEIIANDAAMIKEGATSAFVEYAKTFNKLQVQAGLRYEHVGFDYYNAGKFVAEQSKDYSNLFPSITFSFPIKDVQVQLGYASDINRPSYYQLRSSTVYVNRYMYDVGNPFLMPSITRNVTLGASYKWMNLYIGYSHVKDDIINQTIAYSDDNPTIGLLTLQNTPAYDKFVAALNINPTIGCWTPQLGLAIQKQWYEGETPCGKAKFSKPIGSITFRNNFKLPKGILLDLNGSWTSKGHQNNIYLADDMINTNVSLYKSFLKDRLILQLQANNIFNPKQIVTIYSGIRVLQNTQAMHRQLFLTVRYKFNTTRSKYKGTGAGESQKNRM